jgi:hypothetical protein
MSSGRVDTEFDRIGSSEDLAPGNADVQTSILLDDLGPVVSNQSLFR